MSVYKTILIAITLLASALALGQYGDIRIEAVPVATVADGKSTITVSATIRDRDGRLIPDGTQVVFTTTKGFITDPVIKTQNGVARTTLRAGAIAGLAKITATALNVNATSSYEVEFVTDRSMLSSAKEYIELFSASRPLLYSMDAKVIEGSDPGKDVQLRYKDVEISADDLQLMVPIHEVKARKAILKVGRNEYHFDQLYYKLNTHRGFGTTTYMADEKEMQPFGRWFAMRKVGQRERFGMVEISVDGIKPVEGAVNGRLFEFEEIADSATIIAARKMVAFPRKEVQFQKAEVFVGGARIMKLPLFQVNLNGPTPVLTDQILIMRNNQIALNYPYYLSLKPGETSLLRFRTGDRYGRGSGSVGGAFIDYERNWNRGDEWDGSMVVQGIGRKDWGIGGRQYWRVDDRTDVNLLLDFPAHRSMYGSYSVGRRFDGFSMNFSGSQNRSLVDSPFSSSQYSFVAEKDPTKVGRLPVRLYYGVTGTHNVSSNQLATGTQTTYGLRSRLQSDPISLAPGTTLNTEFAVSSLAGHNAPHGLSLTGSALMSQQLTRELSVFLGYQYQDDGYSSSLLGRHQLTLQLPIYSPNFTFNFFASKSLDIDRVSYQADARLRLMRDTHFGIAYTYERYLGQGFLDYSFYLGYTLGFREFGITYTNRTKRIGFEFLGTRY